MNCTTNIQLSVSLTGGRAMIDAATPATEVHVSGVAAGRRHSKLPVDGLNCEIDVAQREEGHDRSCFAQHLRLPVKRFTCALDRGSAV